MHEESHVGCVVIGIVVNDYLVVSVIINNDGVVHRAPVYNAIPCALG